MLADAVDGGGGGGGGTIDRGTGYTVPQGRRTLGTFDDDPFTYGQRSGELRFFNNSTGGATTGIGGGATTGGTTAGGATAGGATSTAGTPGPAATAAEVQAAYPGYTNIRQDAQGRWFGEPIPGYTASGTPATGLRVTAGGTFDPTVADYQALNPGFETIERNEAGEYVGVRTEIIPGSPGMTEAQVRAQFPGYASYEKDAAGKWVGTRAAQAQSPVTLEQVRAANPGYDRYEQDASGQWFGIKNPTTTAGRAATEADARAQNPGYDAYTKDENGQWVGVKNIAATTSGLLTEAQVRAANPGYNSYEKDADGQWVGIKNIETRTPRAVTLDQVRTQYGKNYDTITQNEDGKFIGTKTIPGQNTSMTLDEIRLAFPQYNRIEQLPTGDYVGITDVTEEVPFTLAQAQEKFGSQYSNIRQTPQGQYIGTRATTRPITLEDVRGLGLDYIDFEQDEAGNFYGIKNVETRTPGAPLTLADYVAKYGSQYSSIRQNDQGQFVGIGSRPTQVLPTIADAQRQYGSAYDAFEQDEAGKFYGLKNVEERAPGAPFTLADAVEKYGSQYSNIYQNDQGQFVGENTETDRNFAEGGEVDDDMVSHLIAYRKGGGVRKDARGIGDSDSFFQRLFHTNEYVDRQQAEHALRMKNDPAYAAKVKKQYADTLKLVEQGKNKDKTKIQEPAIYDSALDFVFKNIKPSGRPTAENVFLRTIQGDAKSISEKDFSADELALLRSMIPKTPGSGVIGYKDYAKADRPTGDEPSTLADTIFGKRSSSTPAANLRNTLGRFSYTVNDDGSVKISDTYDFDPRAGSNPEKTKGSPTSIPYRMVRSYASRRIPPGKGVPVDINLPPNYAEGGDVNDDMVNHLVEYQKGGGHMGPGQVKGIGSGQEDKIPAWLSDGEYVWSAQDVADLGDGSTDEGVRRLDRMRKMVRQRAGRKDVKKIAKPQRGIEDMLKAVGGAV